MTLYHQPTRDQIDLGIAILEVILTSSTTHHPSQK